MAKFVCNVFSYILKRTVDITVVVPTPAFSDAMRRTMSGAPCAHTPKEPYPVLYLLHGMGNNHATWTGYTNVEMYAEERQIAVVNFSAENKSYIPCGEDDFFTFTAEELPDFVCGMFPVSRKPENTYIAGLSMGGYGALIHGLNFSDRFAAIGAFSAAVTPPPAGPQASPEAMWQNIRNVCCAKENPNVERRFDPFGLLTDLAAAQKSIPKLYLACGDADTLLDADRCLRDHAVSLGADVTWDELAGYGHEWRFWDIEIEKFLDWIPRTDPYGAGGKRRV